MITDFERKIVEVIKDEEVEHVFIICSKDNHVYYNSTNGNNKEVDCPVNPDILNNCTIIHNHPIFKWREKELIIKKDFQTRIF